MSMLTKTYTLVEFNNRANRREFTSYAAAASALRKLSADYFIQGPRCAWFFADVSPYIALSKRTLGVSA